MQEVVSHNRVRESLLLMKLGSLDLTLLKKLMLVSLESMLDLQLKSHSSREVVELINQYSLISQNQMDTLTET